MSAAALSSLATPEELYELLDPDVMWYSVDLDSNDTCNGKDAAVGCIQRALDRGIRGRFVVVGERDDFVVARTVLEPPNEARNAAKLFRFRDGLIVEMRDFATTDAALAYSEIS